LSNDFFGSQVPDEFLASAAKGATHGASALNRAANDGALLERRILIGDGFRDGIVKVIHVFGHGFFAAIEAPYGYWYVYLCCHHFG